MGSAINNLHPTARQILVTLASRSNPFINKNEFGQVIAAEPWEIPYHLKELRRNGFVVTQYDSDNHSLTEQGWQYLDEPYEFE